MGALRYTVTIESDTPPKLYLGENIAGGTPFDELVDGLTKEQSNEN